MHRCLRGSCLQHKHSPLQMRHRVGHLGWRPEALCSDVQCSLWRHLLILLLQYFSCSSATYGLKYRPRLRRINKSFTVSLALDTFSDHTVCVKAADCLVHVAVSAGFVYVYHRFVAYSSLSALHPKRPSKSALPSFRFTIVLQLTPRLFSPSSLPWRMTM